MCSLAGKTVADPEQLFRSTLLNTIAFDNSLDELERLVESGQYKVSNWTVCGVYQFGIEARRHLVLARSSGVDFAAFDSSVSRGERRLNELVRRRDALLAQLGPEGVNRCLLQELTLTVRGYRNKLSLMRRFRAEIGREEFDEYQRADLLSDLEAFWRRDRAHLVLPILPANRKKMALKRDLAETDEVLRQHGPDLFGPSLLDGRIQELRSASFVPRERWWWYLDEVQQQ